MVADYVSVNSWRIVRGGAKGSRASKGQSNLTSDDKAVKSSYNGKTPVWTESWVTCMHEMRVKLNLSIG